MPKSDLHHLEPTFHGDTDLCGGMRLSK